MQTRDAFCRIGGKWPVRGSDLFDVTCVVFAAVLAIFASENGYVRSLEQWSSDWRAALFSERNPTQHSHIALVLISDRTLENSPVRIPIDREIIAKLIQTIDSTGPAAIGLDFAFVRPTEPAKDELLLNVINTSKAPIVLGVADDRIGLPIRQLEYHDNFVSNAKARTGHLLFERKGNRFGISDRVIRELPMPFKGRESFGDVLAMTIKTFASHPGSQISWLLPPLDGSDTFYEVDAADLLGAEGASFLSGLRNKIVIIGADLWDADRHLTPLSVLEDARIAGVRIHAQIVAQRIDGRDLRIVSRPMEFLLLILAGFTGYAVGRMYEFGSYPKAVAWVGSAILIGAGIVAFRYELILPYTTALTVWVISVGIGGQSAREYLKLDAICSAFRSARSRVEKWLSLGAP